MTDDRGWPHARPTEHQVWTALELLDGPESLVATEHRDAVREALRLYLPRPYDWPWGAELAAKNLSGLIELDMTPNLTPAVARIRDAARAELIRNRVLTSDNESACP